jgi:hypothetical protein
MAWCLIMHRDNFTITSKIRGPSDGCHRNSNGHFLENGYHQENYSTHSRGPRTKWRFCLNWLHQADKFIFVRHQQPPVVYSAIMELLSKATQLKITLNVKYVQCIFTNYYYYYYLPVTVAAWSKAWTVFARSDAGIVDLNPTQGMDVCVRLFCVCVILCLGSGLATGWSLVQGVLPSV